MHDLPGMLLLQKAHCPTSDRAWKGRGSGANCQLLTSSMCSQGILKRFEKRSGQLRQARWPDGPASITATSRFAMPASLEMKIPRDYPIAESSHSTQVALILHR